MTIVNKRNAVFGWTVWRLGKRMAKKKVRGALPGRSKDTGGGGRTAAAVSGTAAVAGALLFWRRRRSDGAGDSESS